MMAKRKWTNEEISEYRKAHNTIFYFNKEDSRILVPKVYGMGWSFNWASPIAWIFIVIILGLIVFGNFFGK